MIFNEKKIQTKDLSSYLILPLGQLPLGFRKVGRVWCGGARETH